MRSLIPSNIRGRLTFWYVMMLAILLVVYAAIVFAFQYAVLTRQMLHDEVQDVVTVEGLLFYDSQGRLQLRQDYYSHPQSHLLIDRLMEVRDLAGNVLYRSPTLNGMSLGGPNRVHEGEASFDQRIVRLQDGSHVFLLSHIHSMQGRTLLIRLGYSLAPLRIRMIQFLALLLIAVPVSLLLAGVGGHTIALKALRPLQQMADHAEVITANNLGHRLDIKNPDDELGHMARVFNHLLDRLEQSFLQLQRFTADAAHELRTPLASIRAIGEVALEKKGVDQRCCEALESILEENARLNETINSLLLLAKAEATQPGDRQSVFVATELVDEVLNLLDVVIEEHGVTVFQEGKQSTGLSVKADRSLLRIAILNVLHNALKFSPQGSTLRITYSRSDGPPLKATISFHDEGPGIAKGEHHKIFERFFTSSSQATAHSSGTGLGLSVAALVIERAGGIIWFDEEVEYGAKCIIELPIWN